MTSQALDVPLLFEVDVAVIGGGPAGMAAAAAAARAGASTAVIERWPALGGQSTTALVNWWHTSDKQQEVIFGFTHELVERLERYNGVQRLPFFPTHHETYAFSSEWLKLVYEDIIREDGIRCLCYTPCVAARVEGRTLRGAIVGTKAGLREIRAARFIDCTGDGDLAVYAGARHTVGRPSDGKVQGMTLVSVFSGLDTSDADAIHRGHAQAMERLQALQAAGEAPAYGPHWFGNNLTIRYSGSLALCTSGDPLDNEDLTRATMEARRKLPFLVDHFRAHHDGCAHLDIEQTGFSLGIREAHHLQGRYTFTEEDILARRSFPDAVGHGFWMVDVHDPNGTGYTSWYEQDRHLATGTTYQIPYRMLVSADLDNLLFAGRCASATHEGMAGLRVQSHCHIMGQAAGLGAAMSLDANVLPADIDIPTLQRRLVGAGVLIDLERAAGAGKVESPQ